MDDKQKLLFGGAAVVVAIIALASKKDSGGVSVTTIGSDVDVVGLANAEVEGEKARLQSATSIATTLLQLEGVKSEHSRDTTIAGIQATRDVTISGYETARDVTISGHQTARDISVANTQSARDVRLGELHSASEQAGYRAAVDTANIQARAMERNAVEQRKSNTTTSIINGVGSLAGGIIGAVFGGGVGATAGSTAGSKLGNFLKSLF